MNDFGSEFINFSEVFGPGLGTGTNDDTDALVAALRVIIAMTGDVTLYFRPGTYVITGQRLATDARVDETGGLDGTSILDGITITTSGVVIDFPSNVTLKFASGARLSFNPPRIAPVGSGTSITLTIRGAIDAGLWQIFDTSGGGTVVLATRQVDGVYPEWWGARTDPNFDSSPAMQAAFDAAFNNRTSTSPIPVLLSGSYFLQGPLSIAAPSGQALAAVIRGAQGMLFSGSGIPTLTAVWRSWPLDTPNLLEIAGNVDLVVENVSFQMNSSDSGIDYSPPGAPAGSSSGSMGGPSAENYLTATPPSGDPTEWWGPANLSSITFAGASPSACVFRRCSFLRACGGASSPCSPQSTRSRGGSSLKTVTLASGYFRRSTASIWTEEMDFRSPR